jgi:anti-anti-sigma factor
LIIDDAQPAEISHALHGEYDLANAHELAMRLRRFCEASHDVVVDCTHLRFWDSSAIAVVVDLQCSLRAEHRCLRLTNLHGTPLRALEALGLAEDLGATSQ